MKKELANLWKSIRSRPLWQQGLIGVGVLLALAVLFAEDPESTETKSKSAEAPAVTTAAATPSDEGAATTGEEETDATKTEENKKVESKPAPEPKPEKKYDLAADVKKNIHDAVSEKADEGEPTIIDMNCPGGKNKPCIVNIRTDTIVLEAKREIVGQSGDIFDEVFDDTEATELTLNWHGNLVDSLGKETKDDQVATITMFRSAWKDVDWENIPDESNIIDIAEAWTPWIADLR